MIWDYILSLKFWFIVYLFYLLYRFLYFIYSVLLRKRLDLLRRYGANSYVLVTGATDGIGKAMCIEFARIGFNLIMVSRNLSKLTNVAEEIKKIKPDISIHVIEFDFNLRNKLGDYMEVFSNLNEKFDISVLVNNIGTEQHNSFDRVRIDLVCSSLNLNIIPQTLLTKIFLRPLTNRTKRSAIINMSSFAGEFPFPMKSVYAATKIYTHYLSIGLMEETKSNSNIDWLSVKPLEVETVLSTTKADGISVITPKQCVTSILDDLGYETETYSHYTHKIQAFFLLLVPKFILYPVFRNYWFKFFIKRDEKSE